MLCGMFVCTGNGILCGGTVATPDVKPRVRIRIWSSKAETFIRRRVPCPGAHVAVYAAGPRRAEPGMWWVFG
jgi:hypothetical protein